MSSISPNENYIDILVISCGKAKNFKNVTDTCQDQKGVGSKELIELLVAKTQANTKPLNMYWICSSRAGQIKIASGL